VRVEEFLAAVAAAPGSTVAPPPEGSAAQRGLEVPEPLRGLLSRANGVGVRDGHYRLLGLEGGDQPTLARWNHPDTWKHAWAGRADQFYCFGMSSLGDQFALRLGAGGQVVDDGVWVLDGLELQATRLAPTVAAFLEQLVGLAAGHGDDDLVELVEGARERLGAVAPDELLVVVPPVQLGVDGMLDRLQRMPAWMAMTINGDAYGEAIRYQGAQIVGVEPWTDRQGRPRLRFVPRQ